MLASELFAKAFKQQCEGKWNCHWCGALCDNRTTHNDPPPGPFQRTKSTARYPASAYICKGCWLFRRQRVTLYFLDGTFKDGQAVEKHSFILTEDKLNILQMTDYAPLYQLLLNPPKIFTLALLTPDPIMSGKLNVPVGKVNSIQSMFVNENEEVKGETIFKFTINNIPHSYSVYELEQGIRQGGTGREPGVQALLRFLGTPPELPEKIPTVGRPRNDADKSHPKRVVKTA